MKRILIVAFVFINSIALLAQKYNPVVITKADGSVLKGYAEQPAESAVKTINFKPTEDAKKEKLESTDLQKMVFTIDGEAKEFERIKTKYYNMKKEEKISEPVWLGLYSRGYVSVYVGFKKGYTRYGTTGASTWPSDTFFFLKKKSEEAGTPIHLVMTGAFQVGKNMYFKAYGPVYFSDNQEIVDKINSKEYTYEDLDEVVKVYNEWAAKKK